MRCTDSHALLEGYLADTLAAEQRDQFRDHLRGCPDCRRWAVGVEPTLAFVAVDPPRTDRAELDRCAAAVLAQIRQQRLADRLHRGRWRRPATAAAAVLLLGVGSAAVWRLTGEPGAAATGAAPAAHRTTMAAPPPEVRVNMAGEGVRVYQLAAEDDGDTAVYYVVNPAMES